MLLAACCMHDASGAQGEWLDLVCGGPAEHSPMVVPHLPVIRAAAPPGILTPPLPTAAPGPHSALGTGTPVPIPTFRPGPSPQPPRDRAPSPYPRISAPTTSPQTRPPACAGTGRPVRPHPVTGQVQICPIPLKPQVMFSAPRQHDMGGKEKAAVRFASLRSLSFSCDGVRDSSQWMGPLGGFA